MKYINVYIYTCLYIYIRVYVHMCLHVIEQICIYTHVIKKHTYIYISMSMKKLYNCHVGVILNLLTSMQDRAVCEVPRWLESCMYVYFARGWKGREV